MEDKIKFSAGENPYLVEHGGFYRRWMPMLPDLAELVSTVKKITTTTEETWIQYGKKKQKYMSLMVTPL